MRNRISKTIVAGIVGGLRWRRRSFCRRLRRRRGSGMAAAADGTAVAWHGGGWHGGGWHGGGWHGGGGGVWHPGYWRGGDWNNGWWGPAVAAGVAAGAIASYPYWGGLAMVMAAAAGRFVRPMTLTANYLGDQYVNVC